MEEAMVPKDQALEIRRMIQRFSLNAGTRQFVPNCPNLRKEKPKDSSKKEAFKNKDMDVDFDVDAEDDSIY